MKIFSKAALVAIVVCALFASVDSFAEKSFADRGPIVDPGDDYLEGSVRKLGRGVASIAFCWAEVPIKIWDVDNEEGGIAALTYGVIKGSAWTVMRAGTGVAEVLTFCIPLPGMNEEPRISGAGFGPMMSPEFVVDSEHNLFNFVHRETPIMQ